MRIASPTEAGSINTLD